MTIIKQLRALLTADSGDFVKDMSAASKAAKDFKKDSEQAEAGSKKMSSGMDQVTGAIKTLATSAIALQAGRKVIDFLRDSVSEAENAAKAQAQLEAVIRSTGGAAGVTAGDVDDLSEELSRLTGVEDDLIVQNSALMLTFTKVGKEIFPDAMQAALDMSAVLGQSLQSSVVQLGKALNDPIQGVTALRRVGVSFTEDQQDFIKTLVESGQTLEAQKFILQELQTEFGGAATSMYDAGTQSEGLTNAIGNLKEEIGRGLIPVLREANQGLTTLVDDMTASVRFTNDYRDAIARGVITQDEFNRMLDEIGTGANTLGARIEWLEQKVREYEAANEAMDAQWDEGKRVFLERKDAFDELAEGAEGAAGKINDVTIELGELTKAKLAQEAISELNQAFKGGLLDLDEYRFLMVEIGGNLLGLPADQLTASLALAQLKQDFQNGEISARAYYNRIREIAEGLGLLPERLDVDIYLNVHGSIPRLPSIPGHPTPRQYGGPVYAGQSYLVGERGPEIMVPSIAGEIRPLVSTAMPGEGLIIENLTVIGAPGMDTNDIAGEVVRRINMMVRNAAVSGLSAYGGG